MTLIILLCGLALVLVFFEVLLPSGVLGVIAAIAWLAASYLAFVDYGLFGAMLVFGGSLVLGVFLIFLEFKLLGKTNYGGNFFLKAHVGEGNGVAKRADSKTRLGKQAETLTRLNPSGIIRLDGERFEARSVDGFIESGQPVEILSEDTFRLTVKKL